MKKFFPILFVITLLFSGCFQPGKKEDLPMQTTPTTPPPQNAGVPVDMQQDMTAVSLPVITEQTTDTDGNILFTYQVQDMSLVIPDPDVGKKILQDFSNKQTLFREAAERVKVTAFSNTNESPLFFKALFSPSRVDMNVLSLCGTTTSWSGGIHPVYSCIFANYSMVSGDVLTLGSILTHADLADDLGELLIDAIRSIQDTQGIWNDFEPAIRDRFSGNISDDQAWYFSNTGLCFSFPPYEIAPYSSGIITVTIPYSDLVGIIDDAYFPTEQTAATGDLLIQSLDSANLTQFDQIAEIIAEEGGHMVLLYSDATINHVTIELDHSHTIFATATLSPGDAIMLEADLADHILVVQYTSEGQSHSRYIQVAESTVRLLEDIPE